MAQKKYANVITNEEETEFWSIPVSPTTTVEEFMQDLAKDLPRLKLAGMTIESEIGTPVGFIIFINDLSLLLFL